jgi:hypothetical protein
MSLIFVSTRGSLCKIAVVKLWHNCVKTPSVLAVGVSFPSEKQMPQVIGNKQKGKPAIEGSESSRRLAKQVLSQLSYTPTVTL